MIRVEKTHGKRGSQQFWDHHPDATGFNCDHASRYESTEIINDIGTHYRSFQITHISCRESLIRQEMMFSSFPFLEVLDLSYSSFTELTVIGQLYCLKELNLTGCEDVRDLFHLSACTNLRKLDISETSPRTIDALRNLTKLQKLRMRMMQVSDLTPLETLCDLRLLDAECNITDLEPLRGKTELRTLKLISRHRTPPSSLAPLEGMQKLRVLSLTNFHQGLDVSVLKTVGPLDRHVSFARCTLLCDSVGEITPLSFLSGRTIDTLILLGSGLTTPQSVEALRDCTVRKLVLTFDPGDLTDKSMSALKGSHILSHLEKLNISLSGLSDLEFVGECTLLQDLDVSGNNIRDIPQSIQNCRHLEAIDISANNVESIDVLVNSFALPKLRLLFADHNPVLMTDNTVDLLARNTSLTMLNLYATPKVDLSFLRHNRVIQYLECSIGVRTAGGDQQTIIQQCTDMCAPIFQNMSLVKCSLAARVNARVTSLPNLVQAHVQRNKENAYNRHLTLFDFLLVLTKNYI